MDAALLGKATRQIDIDILENKSIDIQVTQFQEAYLIMYETINQSGQRKEQVNQVQQGNEEEKVRPKYSMDKQWFMTWKKFSYLILMV